MSLRIFNPSAQPLLYTDNSIGSDKSIALVMDGELHTILPGKPVHIPGHNDAEVIMHLYRTRGANALSSLQGSFSLILWDGWAECLVALTDRYATRPLYYAYTSKGLVIASEVEGILAAGLVPKQVNEQAVIEFFTFRHPLGDKTLVEGVRILPPAACLIWRGGALRVERYWDLSFPSTQTHNLKWYVDRTAPLLERAIAKQVKKPVTGISLSGGLDSRLLAGVAAAYTSALHTFTNGRPGCPDHRYAQQVASLVGSVHHTIQMAPDFLARAASLGVRLTDGLMTCLDFYSLNTAPVARETEVGALMFGLAGPLGGIALRRSVLQASSDESVSGIYRRFGVYISETLQKHVLTPEFFRHVEMGPQEALKQALEPVLDYPASYQAEFFSYRYRLPRTSFYGPTLVRNWVEVRLPYYDYAFYDAVSRVPPEIRSGRKLQIALLKTLAPALARVPWTYTNLPVHWSMPTIALIQRGRRRLHREISFRTRGMIPPPAAEGQASYAAWFRGPLHNWLEEMLLGQRTIDRGHYNPTALRTMVDQHMAGVRDYSLQFGLLITFELWNRLFIDGDKLPAIER
ncbi:MAG: hypothetical protein H5T62_02320 [Anaerolineae bacterium]|nr:hypothetical protein [Anaerolineae bacterium]